MPMIVFDKSLVFILVCVDLTRKEKKGEEKLWAIDVIREREREISRGGKKFSS